MLKTKGCSVSRKNLTKVFQNVAVFPVYEPKNTKFCTANHGVYTS